jgi:tripartite-type tricarboxylate transporter receptor subunit TctC
MKVVPSISFIKGAGCMSRLARHLTALVAGFAALLVGAALGQAQDYPNRPIRMIVSFGPGTSTDVVTRLFSNALGAELGQTVVVENRPGAGGSIGTGAVAKAPPDGYILTMGTVGTHAINASLFARLSYDPVKDFVPLAFVGYTPTLLVVRKELPVTNVAELVALSKSRPDGIAFASAGTGTSGHLAGELVKNKSGGKMVHVPYKEGGAAVTDVMTGQVQFMFYHPAGVLPHVQSGALRAIGVSSAKRSAAAPDVPTMIEQGFDGFDLVAWFGFYAPAGTPEPVVTRLRQASEKILANPDMIRQLRGQGVELLSMKGDELAAFTPREVTKWGQLVKQSGARID